MSRYIKKFLIIVLIAGWIFSGWPRIWNNPPVPPGAKDAKAATVRMLLFWDGASAPTGWSIVTTYDGKFPRGEAVANFGTTGGNSTHTPTVASVTNSAPSAGTTAASTNSCSSYNHTHASLSVTVGSANNLPAYQSYKLIQFDAGIPVSIPAGAIAIFDAAAPSGWTDQSGTINNKMIEVNSTVGTGGSDTHTHSLTWSSLGTANGTLNTCSGTANAGAATTHTHTAPAATQTASMTALPPYIQVIIAKANSNTASLPNGMIAMFDGDPGSAWTIKSASGGPFYQQFIRDFTSYNGTSQGATTHDHANETSGASGAASAKTKGSSTSGTAAAGSTHTHTLTATFNTGTDNMPLYFNVVYAKKNTNVAPNAPSQDSPANSATGVSVTPTFLMTATDPDPDHLSYKVTIYSNSACTTVVGNAHDQSTNSTGWGGTDATCTNNPTSCYNSGTQGSFTLQSADALSYNTQYWWKASVKDPDGSNTFTDSTTCNTFTTLTPTISVTVSDGVVTYGTIPANTTKSTCSTELNDAQTVTNNGNVNENFNIRGQNSANWTLGATAGSNQYVQKFLNGTCSTFSGGTALTTSDQSFATGIAPSGTATLNLQINTPNPSTVYTQQSVDVTITAVQP